MMHAQILSLLFLLSTISILAALPVPQGEKEVSVLRLEIPRFDRIANMIDKRPPAIYTQHNEDRLKWSSLEELEG
ncbi:hypothetical protein FRB93_009123 [Tulasnella sp. JGI-2019a]|nr:hypothetical protein FRB93_009123 [Tulasnella sp. JGI-2019a]